MIACTACGGQVDERASFCPSCGHSTAASAAPDVGAGGTAHARMTVLTGVLAVPAMLLAVLLVAIVVITYYASVVTAALALGANLFVGIVAATVLLLAIFGLVFYYVRKRKQ